ncbi:hypothetical protein LOK49_LG01G00592 [Camellia lanceoleosa]|uniref:Uncharacterized protein n=1 Tax=Camellia lanceoleosa TaxID=1840588 RepID=A0ACC0IX14_9ERIC|nr:hypothetical protein LOK49_LG01G00592 [Camellia lanceoleosa]
MGPEWGVGRERRAEEWMVEDEKSKKREREMCVASGCDESAKECGSMGAIGGQVEGVLAWEQRSSVNGLAMRVNKGERLGRGLRQREPLEGRGGEDDGEFGVVRERNCEGLALDGVGGRGEREGERGFGEGVEDGGDGERAGVERDRVGVGGEEREENESVDGGR